MDGEQPYVGERAEYGETCQHSSTPADPACARPATRHVAVYAPSHGKVVGLATCADHEVAALRSGTPYGAHDWGEFCGEPDAAWVTGLGSGESWCA